MILSRGLGMEDRLVSKEQRLEVWEVVDKLGRPLQGHACDIR
jgi:hypothetical protein